MDTENIKKKCPKCATGTLDYRTPRAFWIKALLFWLPLKRYKCTYCSKKTYVYSPERKNELNVVRD